MRLIHGHPVNIDSLGLWWGEFSIKKFKDNGLMYDYASRMDATGARRILKLSQKKEFLTYELEILNERYAPISRQLHRN
jgi:hypothetical protein